MADIDLVQSATPASPSAGRNRMFFGTDGLLQSVDSTGTVLNYGKWVFLGSTILAASAANTAVVTIPAYTELLITVNISSYPGGADIASLRFNADSAANYWDRHLTVAAAGVAFTNVQNASTTLIRLAGATATTGRVAVCNFMNQTTRSKVGTIQVQTLTGAAATVGIMDFGSGEWVNTTAQITSVQMLTAGGLTMGTGSGFSVFGATPT